ncbi:6,7-dimethyl-8-ribityllumazine synthase [Caldovatus aquaticus]|uniref:6,7-dimethyl-8-ribityllumazine synthase n=1 Tax=Caldovatus aquaticus TaxID=2865671 RepID=A0ABS7EZ20_9PROT|nr:6,7-dimethyl-8-ribityllumazine synthase [Caldovatus aquaticus]
MSTADSPVRAAPRIEGPPPRVLVLQAPYYRAVIEGLRQGADPLLAAAGATVETAEVAGAFELPGALRLALRAPRRRWDGFLVLGCVVKGETDHYDHICREACRGVMDIAVETGVPIGFGLLTVHTLAQAEARARPDRHNKGAEAAQALLTQIALARRWGVA